MSPKVSVVIPSYNHGRYLAARLDSVLGQTFQDFEVLFLDDASPDDSLRVFEAYKHHPKIRADLNEVNSGCVFKQWNKGVRAARGEYVWIAESDDVADPKFLETLVPVLDANPNVGLAYTNSTFIDEDGKTGEHLDEYTRPIHPTRWQSDFVNDGKDECRRYLLLQNNIPNASAVLIRKSVYEAVGYANESMKMLGDWEMWVRILLASDIAYVATPRNYFRRPHDHSVRKKSWQHPTRTVDFMRIVNMILPLGLDAETRVKVAEYVAHYWLHQNAHSDGIEAPIVHARIMMAAREMDPDLLLGVIVGGVTAAARVQKTVEYLSKLTGELHWALTHQDGFVPPLRAKAEDLWRRHEDLWRRHEELHRFALGLHDAAVTVRGETEHLRRTNQELSAVLDDTRARLAAAEGAIAELARQARFWDRVRRVVLPVGGWRHRLLKKSVGLVRGRRAA